MSIELSPYQLPDFRTAIRVVPQRTAEMMRTVALSYPGLEVITIAESGHTYPHPTDFTFTHRVKDGHEAVTVTWVPHRGLYPKGVPAQFYKEVTMSLHFPETIPDYSTLSPSPRLPLQ